MQSRPRRSIPLYRTSPDIGLEFAEHAHSDYTPSLPSVARLVESYEVKAAYAVPMRDILPSVVSAAGYRWERLDRACVEQRAPIVRKVS